MAEGRESYRTAVEGKENPERTHRTEGRGEGCRHCYRRLTGSCFRVRGQSVLKKEVYKCLATTNSKTPLKRKSGRVGGKWSFSPRGRGPPASDDTDTDRSQAQVGIFQSKGLGGKERGKAD